MPISVYGNIGEKSVADWKLEAIWIFWGYMCTRMVISFDECSYLAFQSSCACVYTTIYRRKYICRERAHVASKWRLREGNYKPVTSLIGKAIAWSLVASRVCWNWEEVDGAVKRMKGTGWRGGGQEEGGGRGAVGSGKINKERAPHLDSSLVAVVWDSHFIVYALWKNWSIGNNKEYNDVFLNEYIFFIFLFLKPQESIYQKPFCLTPITVDWIFNYDFRRNLRKLLEAHIHL